MFKIFRKIDFQSPAWLDYIKWRNFNFRSFESVDSKIRESIFEITTATDWEFAFTLEGIQTDILTDLQYARKFCIEHSGDEVVEFCFLEELASDRQVLGYDILDGELRYSLLTNFGNNIQIVNDCLCSNALIRHLPQAQQVHAWFAVHMPKDPHVMKSKIVAAYGRL